MNFRGKWAGLSATSLLLSITVGFADDKNPPFQAKPAAAYEAKTTLDQVTVAIEPYDTAQKQAEAFGKLPLEKYSLLPVLVVIENKRATPVDLKQIEFRLTVPGVGRIEPTPAADIPYLESATAPKMIKIPLPIPISRKKKNPLASPILDARAFSAKVIAPGDTASGFLFFQINHHGQAKIYLSGLWDPAAKKELFYYEIAVDLK